MLCVPGHQETTTTTPLQPSSGPLRSSRSARLIADHRWKSADEDHGLCLFVASNETRDMETHTQTQIHTDTLCYVWLNFDPGQRAKPGLKLKKITQMRKQLIVTDIKL